MPTTSIPASPSNLGQRLREARKASGLTQDAVAKELKVPRTSVVAFEQGDRRVTSAELIALSRLYSRPLTEFVGTRAESLPFAPQFRAPTQSASSITEAEVSESVLKLESLARDYLEIEQMTNSPLPRNYLEPYQIEYSRASPEDRGEEVADAERNRLGLGDAPVADLRSIIEEAVGLRIYYIDLPSKVGGLFAYTDDLGGCIAINRKHPPRRAKWSLAHEYGHFLTTRYQADVEMLDARWGKPAAEKFADSFAANFLMPRSGVCRHLAEMAKARQGQVTIADVLSLAELYQVSTEAMFRRLEDLKRLSPGTWQKLKTQGLRPAQARSALGMSPDDPVEPMFPHRYRSLAVGAFNAGEMSEESLAAKLRTDILGARLEREKLTDYATTNGDGFAALELDPSQLL